MLTNGCYQSSNETECNSVVNGLFAKGLHLALQYFIQSVNTVLMARHEGSYWNMSVSVSARVTWNVFAAVLFKFRTHHRKCEQRLGCVHVTSLVCVISTATRWRPPVEASRADRLLLDGRACHRKQAASVDHCQFWRQILAVHHPRRGKVLQILS